MEIPGNGRIMPPGPMVAGEKTASANKANAKQGLALELEKRRLKEPTLVALAALPGGACQRATVQAVARSSSTFTSGPGAYPIGRD